MEKIELNIKGMHCEGCSTRLEKVLNNLDGVEKANVSLEKAVATIEYNKEKVTLEEIKEAVYDCGFEVI